MWKYTGILLLFVLEMFSVSGQPDSTRHFTFNAYAEAYFSYDFNRPGDHLRPPFFYSFNKHNQPRFNIALLQGSYNTDRFRANAGIMAGTYSRYNLAQEPELLRHINEANVGIRLGKDIWLDAGVLPSHIGMESAIGKDCYSLTRSIMADNSPYIESGARLSYNKGKWYAAIFLLNGWQRISPVKGNSLPSLGHQLQYRPNEKLMLNSSSFIGTDKPDAERKMRYFHNFYTLYQASSKFDLQFAFDIGAEQKAKGSGQYNGWWTMVGGLRYKPWRKCWLGSVMEYYHDPGGVMTSTETGLPLTSFGFSETLDYHINKHLQWRVEWRWLHGKDQVYLRDGVQVRDNNALTTSLAFSW